MLTEAEEESLRALLDADRPDDAELSGLRALLARRAELEALARRRNDLEAVVQEARTIGAASLLRRLFVLVAEGTETMTDNTEVTLFLEDVPVNANADLAHTHYLLSVYDTAMDDDVTGQNAAVIGTSGPNAIIDPAIHTAILKRRATSGDDRIVVELRIRNFTGDTVDMAYQVYRIPRLGAVAPRI